MKFNTISKLFETYSNKTDLFKCYLTVNRESGQKYLSNKNFAANKFFIQINEDNVETIDFDPNFPILNYNSIITKRLLNRGAKIENVYNKPDEIMLSGSKVKFHEMIGDDENLPKTVFTKNDALTLNFPIIAKPSEGHSGIGIQVIDKKENVKNVDSEKFDLYSEMIDKIEEHRVFLFKGVPFTWLERNPLNDKAKNGGGKLDEEMNFKYILRDVNSLDNEYRKVIAKYSNFLRNIPFLCLDMMKDKNGKIYVIESNAQPGAPFDVMTKLYERIFLDFFGRPLKMDCKNALMELEKELINNTLNSDKDRFEIKL